jgi:hypothetical protein
MKLQTERAGVTIKCDTAELEALLAAEKAS